MYNDLIVRWLVIFFSSAIWAIVCNTIAELKGIKSRKWTILGFFFGFIIFLILSGKANEFDKSQDNNSLIKMDSTYLNQNENSENFITHFINNCPLLINNVYTTNDKDKQKASINVAFRNIGQQDIIGISLNIKAYNSTGKIIELIENLAYINLNFDSRGICKSNKFIYIDTVDLKNVSITLNKIIYDNLDIQEFHDEYQQIFTGDDLKTKWNEKNYRYLISKSSVLGLKTNRIKYEPYEEYNFWICCCGQLNLKESTTCHKCHSDKERVFEIINEDKISEMSKQVEQINNTIYEENSNNFDEYVLTEPIKFEGKRLWQNDFKKAIQIVGVVIIGLFLILLVFVALLLL